MPLKGNHNSKIAGTRGGSRDNEIANGVWFGSLRESLRGTESNHAGKRVTREWVIRVGE
jgi:hypothetical protein